MVVSILVVYLRDCVAELGAGVTPAVCPSSAKSLSKISLAWGKITIQNPKYGFYWNVHLFCAITKKEKL